ncbi:MarR family transcriptional regulator [Erythrobacter sp. SG61-1L]|uniref:MarR family winged helix-turn-helix transcriptional regulator n=1 Tax=Erythrobacter sp. SG61-1L TaxID=1603897 RepID=UPI0006C8E9BE|nr:MarR family transcriptional regulator [Erythrobacter sp. SG61-1L]
MSKSDDPGDFASRLLALSQQLLSMAGAVKSVPDEEEPQQNPWGTLGEVPDETLLVYVAEAIYRHRQARRELFPVGLFGEPGWDILLDLYISSKRNRQVTVSDACLASLVPSTTALRSLAQLEQEGLVERHRDPQDGRRIYVRMLPEAEVRMVAYLTGVLRERQAAGY